MRIKIICTLGQQHSHLSPQSFKAYLETLLYHLVAETKNEKYETLPMHAGIAPNAAVGGYSLDGKAPEMSDGSLAIDIRFVC